MAGAGAVTLFLAAAATHAAEAGTSRSAARNAPAADMLMKVVFPHWSGTDSGRIVPLRLSQPRSDWSPGPQEFVLATPVAVALAGDAARATLVVALNAADAVRELPSAHGTPAALAAYDLAWRGSRWTVMAKHEGFAYLGYGGLVTADVYQLDRHRQGIAIRYGTCYQGHCFNMMSMYQAIDGTFQLAPVIEDISERRINAYAGNDCAERLRSYVRLKDFQHIPGDPGAAFDCRYITSTMVVAANGDIVFTYSGALSPYDGRAGALAARKIDQHLVLRYRDGKYLPLEGSNPMDGMID